MKSIEVDKLRQEHRKKMRKENIYEVEDSKCFLKQAISTRGGEKLEKERQLAQEQQKVKDEERAFNEMLERNNEDEELGWNYKGSE
ncbi:hypothetical protein IMSHALPRED_002117 [Imshaugia aleurites]|uniref:Uncharacterized protein n=1 Tax=Imshaugia aleurites TaxID=172621 RepID=A0A8H3J4N0_9LECA|nr:hypothetical protein IMSHALPRED_002117 [Imshaugia aleurites]